MASQGLRVRVLVLGDWVRHVWRFIHPKSKREKIGLPTIFQNVSFILGFQVRDFYFRFLFLCIPFNQKFSRKVLKNDSVIGCRFISETVCYKLHSLTLKVSFSENLEVLI